MPVSMPGLLRQASDLVHQRRQSAVNVSTFAKIVCAFDMLRLTEYADTSSTQ